MEKYIQRHQNKNFELLHELESPTLWSTNNDCSVSNFNTSVDRSRLNKRRPLKQDQDQFQFTSFNSFNPKKKSTQTLALPIKVSRLQNKSNFEVQRQYRQNESFDERRRSCNRFHDVHDKVNQTDEGTLDQFDSTQSRKSK